MKKRTNYTLYILMALIVAVAGRYVSVRFGYFNAARQARLEAVEPLHQLQVVASGVQHEGAEFHAAVLVSDLDGVPLKADLAVYVIQDEEPVRMPGIFYTDYDGRGAIGFSLYGLADGRHGLIISVTSELGQEYLETDVRVTSEFGQQFIVHFDKGLYNPGDLVLFRIMALAGASARPLAGGAFSVAIFDGNDNRVYYEAVQASDFGIISGRFQLGDEVNSGLYRLAVMERGEVRAEAFFEVSPFVLPRFGVTLETDKTEYHVGETVQVTGSMMYFFGEPVNQGRLTLYLDGERQFSTTELNEDGSFLFEFEAYRAGFFHLWVEVIDNSNYRIETALTVSASEGAFIIDVMPEHGHLVMGMPNRVYVFTHTVGGAPVRTFLQITAPGFSRQVATDDNGIGVFILDDIASNNLMQIHAQDMDGNSVQGEFAFAGEQRNFTLSTDRARYAMGDTIELTFHHRSGGGQFVVYAFRNEQLLQMVETQHDRAELNLGDAFGIIDIYATWVQPGQDVPLERREFVRRTIFIDPGHTMQLTVQSNQPEYEPGDWVHLNFHVADGAGNPLEAALLVSIVDEAMLALAANDLSVDNVRLALADIRFGDDMDAATLYMSLIAGASEQAISRLLLRQDDFQTFLLPNTPGPSIRTATLMNPLPVLPDGPDGFSRFLNGLRIYLVAVFAIAFFISLSNAKKRDAAMLKLHEAGYLPDEMDDSEKLASGRRQALFVVFVMLALVAVALFAFTACGRNYDSDDAPSITMEAPWSPGDMAAPDFAPAPAPDVAQAPSVVTPPDLPPQAEAPAEITPPADDPPTDDTPTEIETQTARVRRLFLETMLFVPELIAHDGAADLSFILADNITTWNIQVVGNTRDGIVGHTQSNFRAFQPFFVDFELPRNSVRYDRISIPVTVFNYTEEALDVVLTIAEMDWFELYGDAVQILTVEPNRSVMMYVPIRIVEFGSFVFRAYADAFGFADAAERPITVNPEGFRIRQVVSSGSIEGDTWRHLLFMHENIPGTRRASITFYPSVMSHVLEGMENIFRMPFGCFEQTSSILYPNILALRYLQQNNLDNPALTDRALRYISSGYQRLLTFEVGRQTGGFSLFGHAPAETVLTAYGLMQLTNLSEVYSIDERVLYRMKDFLFDHQNNDGSFQITGRNIGRISNSQQLAFSAYITWALSETMPDDPRLASSVDFLLSRLDAVDDNYTLALIANVLVNIDHPRATEIVDRLVNTVIHIGDTAYVTSTTRDYFGAFGRIQYLQATALTSIALSTHGSYAEVNDRLINYIISQRDTWGTWHSTQATILSLKALTRQPTQAETEDGIITVTLGNTRHTLDIIAGQTLDLYTLHFTDLDAENFLEIEMTGVGRMTYKIVQEFFAPYDSVTLDRGFEVLTFMFPDLTVHELVEQEIIIINTSGGMVDNGLVAVSIPQGFRVERSSLTRLQHQGLIERYEFRFDNINLYLRDTEPGEILWLTIAYRPAFPVEVTGGHVRVFDYYNPMIEGYALPMEIVVR
ncbi:MAG: MG2 domain-containing protein [Defluviitaleaceae bacterium]|nr:MG2 domain-containing protein [Defluviitaleaceae bacterium]